MKKRAFQAAVLMVCALLPGAAESVEFRVTERLTVMQGLEVSTSATASPLLFISSTTGAGNVGIGTTSPAAKLHMSSGTLLVDGNAATSFRVGVSTFIINSSGNVGIGTTAPGGTLTVKGDTRFESAGTASPIDYGWRITGPTADYDTLYLSGEGVTGNNTFGDIGDGNSLVSFKAKGENEVGIGYDAGAAGHTAKLSVNGNVGIGTTNPGAKLHVTGGDLKVDGSRIIRKINVQTDSVTRNFTAWAVGMTFATIPGFKAGSLVRLTYHIPMRNDGAGWGGGYTEPQISFNGGTTWNSLGSSGYDGGVMCLGSGDCIGSYNNSILIDPAQGADFSVTVRFYHKAYDQTLTVNGSHDVNAVSGTATIMPGVNGLQHWTTAMVEELY